MTKRAGKKKKSPAAPKETKALQADSQNGMQSIATGGEVLSPEVLAYWPELKPAMQEQARLTGKLEGLQRINDIRTTLRFVREGTVPPEMIERILFDAFLTTQSDKATPELKHKSRQLILGFDVAMKRAKKLPDQIEAANSGPTINVTINQVLKEIDKRFGDIDLDGRDYKVLPGSKDDYAE